MSGDIDVRYGGAISVDTDALRDIGSRMVAASAEMWSSWSAANAGHTLVTGSATHCDWVGASEMGANLSVVRLLSEELGEDAAATLVMADAFEVVELRAQADALAAGGGAGAQAEAAALRARADELIAADPRVEGLVDGLMEGWEEGRFEGLASMTALGAVLFGVSALTAISRSGVLSPGASLRGKADAVRVTPVKVTEPKGPPTSIPGALRRFPGTGGAQVKVERYDMPDGTSRYVVYAKGTQSAGYGGTEPWDMKSNTEMYTGRKSASYQATLDALEASGAAPGDRVDIVAYSQAGMIASYLAMDTMYDVGVEVTAGSPVEPTLDDDQTLVQLRHTDDPVSSLSGGGSPGGTGSPDSFTVDRVADDDGRMNDIMMPGHDFEAYVETAEMLEASGDHRLDGIDALWKDLAKADSITSTEYHAERLTGLSALVTEGGSSEETTYRDLPQ